MTLAPPTNDVDEPAEALAEKAKLQKHFGRADIFFFLVCTLVGVDGLGTLATEGGAGFTWLIVAVVLFAVPSALILSELGAAYTEEGGPYIWVRLAFGHLAGAINNFFYWVTNPVWMGGTLVGTAIGGLTVFMNDGNSWGTTPTLIFGFIFIWAGVVFAILSFKVGKWVATIGAIARFLLLGFFTVLVIAYGAKHGFHGPPLHEYLKPTYSSFVLLVPLILFSLVGFELPSAAGEEMEDAANDVPAGIAKSVLATALLYGLPVLGILTVLPAAQSTGLAGFPDAIKQALTVFGGSVTTASDGTVTATLSGFGTVMGWVAGILVAIIAFTSGLTWIMGSDRTLAVSCYDGAGPRSLGKFSARFGTPLRVNILSGVVSTAVLVATALITDGNAYKFFSVALSLAISTTLISYLGIFPAAWVLRRRRPNDTRPYRAPMLAAITILCCAGIVFCTIQVLFPGAGDEWFGDDYRFSDDWVQSEKWSYLFTEAVPLVIFLAISVSFWWMGKRHREATARELDAGLPLVEPAQT
ncbi:amino acid/polyamine/organocation transporter (APC superfamily) [Jatrophihabitans sp. GAS493]|uniref:APC family permease n=1 Tax=Jatrophihabitans sp. GAS493 TaxID=1907575 RepID=UPI000BB8C0FF|nr:APC family permease [Jatrophihabitans sp. GAS493]SOD74561.1 amino acid/polyamine/organocation transporter (APC superfamily) [Jatrophihabitans sp. GAS493]